MKKTTARTRGIMIAIVFVELLLSIVLICAATVPSEITLGFRVVLIISALLASLISLYLISCIPDIEPKKDHQCLTTAELIMWRRTRNISNLDCARTKIIACPSCRKVWDEYWGKQIFPA